MKIQRNSLIRRLWPEKFINGKNRGLFIVVLFCFSFLISSQGLGTFSLPTGSVLLIKGCPFLESNLWCVWPRTERHRRSIKCCCICFVLFWAPSVPFLLQESLASIRYTTRHLLLLLLLLKMHRVAPPALCNRESCSSIWKKCPPSRRKWLN